MDNLRLILIIGGVILLAGIYLWGVMFARRRDAAPRIDAEDPVLKDDLDSIQDMRAVQNVEELVNLENYDIDEDLERGVARGERLSEREQAAADVESEVNEISTGRIEQFPLHDPIDDEDITPVRMKQEEKDIPKVADIDFEPGTEDLSGIRATRTADDEVPMGQLDLLRFDEENDRPAAPARPAGKTKGDDNKVKAGQMETLAVSITVMAREGQRFSGADLRHWLQSLELEHGEMGIFHRRGRGKSRRAPPVFSVANVVKPGTFELDAMADMTTPGVAMFMQLPGPDDPSAAFEEMIRAARKLAEGLNGLVCDDTRSTLTGQVINHLREQISEFSRKQRLRF